MKVTQQFFDQRSERNKQQRNNYDQQERQPFMVADKHQQHRQRHGMIILLIAFCREMVYLIV